MNHTGPALLAVTTVCALVAKAPAQDVAQDVGLGAAADTAAKILYEQADPTAEEQLLLELVNRARLDPVDEGLRIFADYGSAAVTANVDAFAAQVRGSWTRTENRDRWAGYTPRPALALNPRLMRVSHGFSQAMKARDTVAQSFPEIPGLLSRVGVTGYDPMWLAQLLQGYTGGVLTTHASWAIDWGQQPIGGGRPSTPNRNALMNLANVDFLNLLEAGIGIVKRPNPPPGSVGPHVTTMTFGRSRDFDRRFVTGVVFDDIDGDGFYDIGEGIGGVRIDVEPSLHYAITSASGGYAVPVAATAGTVTVTAAGAPGKPSETFVRQVAQGDTSAFGDPANVKIDFARLPRPDPPPETGYDGAVGAGVAGGEASFDVTVPAIDSGHPTVGDIDLDLDIAHPDRSRLRVVLEAPGGTRVTLWEGGPGGADLRGSFDATLRARERLAAFVDQPYEGTWRLFVADSAGDVPSVRSWRLRLRPRWEGPLHARAPHLFVTKLRIRDRKRPGGDRLLLRGEIDVGASLPADAGEQMVLILREIAAPHVELARIPLAGAVGTSGVVRTGDATFALTPSVKGTSRARVNVNVKDLDLPPLPRVLRLELGVGEALVSEDVSLSRGRFVGRRTAPENGTLRIDSLRSRAHALGLRTDLRGRFLESALPRAPAVVEVRIGDAAGLWLQGPVAVNGSTAVFGASGDFTKLVLDTATGRFSARAVGAHDPVGDDGRVPISLWIGKHYEAITVTPRRETSGDLRY